MSDAYIPATPYAKLLAKERGINFGMIAPSGFLGEIRARDIPAPGAGAARATPLARRMAGTMGVDLGSIKGTGYEGKVCKTDVLAAARHGAEQAGSSAQQARRDRMSGMRRVVAKRMIKAHTEIPPVTHVVRNDVTSLLEARGKLNASGDRKYSVNDLVLKAVVKALRSNPQMLVNIDGEEIIYNGRINIGMAVAVDTGLIVPVINAADSLGLAELSEAAADLAVRARTNKLLPNEYAGNTFTVTNLGMFEVESFTPIINQPDAAILGLGCVTEELAIDNGVLTVRKIMRTCLTYDHRLLDGASASRFQLELKRLLENPIEIMM